MSNHPPKKLSPNFAVELPGYVLVASCSASDCVATNFLIPLIFNIALVEIISLKKKILGDKYMFRAFKPTLVTPDPLDNLEKALF